MNPYLLAFLKTVMPLLVWKVALIIPGRSSRIARRECQNKIQIMALVQEVTSVLPPKGTHVALPELVDRCYDLGPFPALWAVEGLGHHHGETAWESDEEPRNLLTTPGLESLPAKSMPMLHAGIGLSFAKQCLNGLKGRSSDQEVIQAIERFVRLCRDSSRDGYVGCALESLGLVSRFVHGTKMVRRIDTIASQVDADLAAYMWHGVGRAVYFSPPNFIPGFRTLWRGIPMCQEEAPHELAHRNMLAGFAWALTVVNMRHPEIMETGLDYYGAEFSRNDAFSNGVASSLLMRYDTTPGFLPEVEAFYQREAMDPSVAKEWRELVREPVQTAIQQRYPQLQEQSQMQEVFRCPAG